MVDEFGGLDRAVEVAKELAKIPKDKGVHRVILPYPRTFLQELLAAGDETRAQTVKRKQQAAVYRGVAGRCAPRVALHGDAGSDEEWRDDAADAV